MYGCGGSKIILINVLHAVSSVKTFKISQSKSQISICRKINPGKRRSFLMFGVSLGKRINVEVTKMERTRRFEFGLSNLASQVWWVPHGKVHTWNYFIFFSNKCHQIFVKHPIFLGINDTYAYQSATTQSNLVTFH